MEKLKLKEALKRFLAERPDCTEFVNPQTGETHTPQALLSVAEADTGPPNWQYNECGVYQSEEPPIGYHLSKSNLPPLG